MGLVTGNLTVDETETPVALSSDTRTYRRIYVQADSGNGATLIAIGGPSAAAVNATASSQKGRVLAAREAVELQSVKPSEIFCATSVDGGKVTWMALDN